MYTESVKVLYVELDETDIPCEGEASVKENEK